MKIQGNRLIAIVAVITMVAIHVQLPAARAAIDPIEIDLGYGKIKAMVGANADELTGSFEVTKKNPDNTTMTLQQLEKFLGQDHLNWFQKVTDQQPAASIPPGVNIPFIDPPNGGLPINVDPTWADNRPWYYDEFVPNPVPMGRTVENGLQLSANSAGSKLSYFDAPGGQPKDTVISFSTFLVSDYGNKTYDILGKGYSWKTKFPDNTKTGMISDITKNIDFTMEFQNEIKNDFGWLRAKGADTSQSNPQSPAWTVRERAPGGAVVNVQPTNDGKQIQNTDGSIVQFSKSVPNDSTFVDFTLPGIINGKKVTDATQNTGKGRDPGTLSFSVFDNSMMMTQDSLSSWLWNNGFRDPSNSLYMPDFFPDPSSGMDEVFYGVDMDQVTIAGKNFFNTHAFGQTLSVGSLMALLPSYVFSSTPLTYTPGTGWVGTPLDPGTLLSYVAVHDAFAVPEPAALVMFVCGAAIMLTGAQRKRVRRA